MSERGTGEPSELARKIAHVVVCAVIPSGWVVPAIKYEAAVAADRELTGLALVPVEVLEQAIEAMDLGSICECITGAGCCKSCRVKLRQAMSELRAAVQGSGEGK